MIFSGPMNLASNITYDMPNFLSNTSSSFLSDIHSVFVLWTKCSLWLKQPVYWKLISLTLAQIIKSSFKER